MFLEPGTVPDAIWVDEVGRFIEAVQAAGPMKTKAAVFRRTTPIGSNLPLMREAICFIASLLAALPDPAQGLLVSKVLYDELGGHSAEQTDPERAMLRRVGRRRIVALRSGAVALSGAR